MLLQSERIPDSGKVFHFMTSVMDVDPGLIAHLYKMRWKIEKTFDELKTKLTEKKACVSPKGSALNGA